ncbi:MAG: hypothetical protein LBF72_03820 [Holosporales bacterium]|jgi:hypothetical protein|nr:hypothetical protein [Holosporales bacterium]
MIRIRKETSKIHKFVCAILGLLQKVQALSFWHKPRSAEAQRTKTYVSIRASKRRTKKQRLRIFAAGLMFSCFVSESLVQARLENTDAAFGDVLMKPKLRVSLTEALLAFSSGLIDNIRCLNIKPITTGGRNDTINAKNKGPDAVTDLCIALFPSNGGLLNISTSHPTNLAHVMQQLPLTEYRCLVIASFLKKSNVVRNGGSYNISAADILPGYTDENFRASVDRVLSLIDQSLACEQRIRSLYPEYITEVLILAFAIHLLDGDKGDVLKLFAALENVDLLDSDAYRMLNIQNPVNYANALKAYCASIQKKPCQSIRIMLGNWPISANFSAEEYFVGVLGGRSLIVPYSPDGSFEQNMTVTKQNGRTFPDCVETAIRHLFYMMCPYVDGKISPLVSSPQKVQDFVKQHNTRSHANGLDLGTHTAFAELVAGIAGAKYSEPGDLESNWGNIVIVLAYLIGVDINALVQEELDKRQLNDAPAEPRQELGQSPQGSRVIRGAKEGKAKQATRITCKQFLDNLSYSEAAILLKQLADKARKDVSFSFCGKSYSEISATVELIQAAPANNEREQRQEFTIQVTSGHSAIVGKNGGSPADCLKINPTVEYMRNFTVQLGEPGSSTSNYVFPMEDDVVGSLPDRINPTGHNLSRKLAVNSTPDYVAAFQIRQIALLSDTLYRIVYRLSNIVLSPFVTSDSNLGLCVDDLIKKLLNMYVANSDLEMIKSVDNLLADTCENKYKEDPFGGLRIPASVFVKMFNEREQPLVHKVLPALLAKARIGGDIDPEFWKGLKRYTEENPLPVEVRLNGCTTTMIGETCIVFKNNQELLNFPNVVIENVQLNEFTKLAFNMGECSDAYTKAIIGGVAPKVPGFGRRVYAETKASENKFFTLQGKNGDNLFLKFRHPFTVHNSSEKADKLMRNFDDIVTSRNLFKTSNAEGVSGWPPNSGLLTPTESFWKLCGRKNAEQYRSLQHFIFFNSVTAQLYVSPSTVTLFHKAGIMDNLLKLCKEVVILPAQPGTQGAANELVRLGNGQGKGLKLNRVTICDGVRVHKDALSGIDVDFVVFNGMPNTEPGTVEKIKGGNAKVIFNFINN